MAKRMDKSKVKVRIGDLDTVVSLRFRTLNEPNFGDVDFDEDFTDHIDVWSSVNTKSGVTIFNGVNTEVVISHEIVIRYEDGITAEMWIELEGGILLDIEKVENINEDYEFLSIMCSLSGDKDKASTRL